MPRPSFVPSRPVAWALLVMLAIAGRPGLAQPQTVAPRDPSLSWVSVKSLPEAAEVMSERVLRERPAFSNYRYELALEGILDWAAATSNASLTHRATQAAAQAGIAPSKPVPWRRQPFGCLTYALFESTQDQRWLEPFLEESEAMKETIWRDQEGIVLHPRGSSRGGGYAMLIDAMQEYVARMSRTARHTGDAVYLAESARQLRRYRDVLRNRETGLWSQGRGWLADSPEQLSPGAWSRGHGWLLRGLVAALEAAPAGQEETEQIRKIFVETCAALLPRQQPDGSWHTLLHRVPEASPIDISGTAMIATAMSQGYRRGWLRDRNYLEASQRAFALLPAFTTTDGRVLSVSPGPGPLQSEADYLTDRFPADNDHGLFAILFAAAEQQRVLNSD